MKHTHPRTLRRYEPLSRLGDYKVEHHQPDPRGWSVLSPEGRTIGEVKDLIVDTERMRSRYLDVELDTAIFDLRADPHVMVPVEQARRDGTHHRLIVDGLTVERVAQLSEARERYINDFWERWWFGDAQPHATETHVRSAAAVGAPPDPRIAEPLVPEPHHAEPQPTVGGAASKDDLRRVLEGVKSGEQVRIPVVEEEIVVERRPVTRN